MTDTDEVTVREAARRVHRSEETVRRWIWSGRLPARKHGTRYRIDIAHLDHLAVEYEAEHPGRETDESSLGRWLDDLDRWKASLSAGQGASAAGLVIEDRRARR
ncbi:MAG TPA: helix-turn-helix domain-containing protein [Streptosporangiaceae bacterium]|jgi:excisionase family DNA binding protein|nr:helix-turn-helix domain-containing protein [Streptosporangiaceae bacterium]